MVPRTWSNAAQLQGMFCEIEFHLYPKQTGVLARISAPCTWVSRAEASGGASFTDRLQNLQPSLCRGLLYFVKIHTPAFVHCENHC